MTGKLIVCFITAFALIQPFNTLPAASPEASPDAVPAEYKQEAFYRNTNGEYITSNGVILNESPFYWRHKNSVDPKKEHVIIVEPTITYSRQAEYSTTQTAPSTTTFRASAMEGQSDFRPYDGRTEIEKSPYYYIRAASNDRNDIEERRRIEENKRITIDVSDPSYQRFAPRDGSGAGQRWYPYSERPAATSSSPSPSSYRPVTNPKYPSVRFYYSNGSEIVTHNSDDGRQVMDIHPNRYVIQVTELTTTTTTPRPDYTTTDCPPYQPCNAVVYQQTTQCCKCYLLPATRCCPCTYPAKK